MTDEMRADGWIEHRTKKRPVNADDQVRVMFRDGGKSSRPMPAFYWDKLWRGEGMHRSNDIIAYKPEPKP